MIDSSAPVCSGWTRRFVIERPMFQIPAWRRRKKRGLFRHSFQDSRHCHAKSHVPTGSNTWFLAIDGLSLLLCMANTGRFFTSRVTNTSQIYKGAQNRDTRGWFRNRARPTLAPLPTAISNALTSLGSPAPPARELCPAYWLWAWFHHVDHPLHHLPRLTVRMVKVNAFLPQNLLCTW